MKLKKSQREHLLELISEGLQTDEINKRAAGFGEPYRVSRSQVDFYRGSRKVKLEAVKEASETGALKTGFARKEERVLALNELAGLMFEDLKEGKGLWLPQVKSVGTGDAQTIVDYEEFNSGEVQQFRGVLDDIAKEVGDRRQKIDVKVDPRAALAELLGVSPNDLPADSDSGNAHP